MEYTDEQLKKELGIDDAMLARFKEVRENAIQEAKKMAQKTGPIKVLGISGSSRSVSDMVAENSHSEFLLKEALKEAEALGARTDLVALREYDIQPCKCCYSTSNAHCHFYCSCYPKDTSAGDDMTNILYDKILEADAIIFATPVNNYKISSRMALFLDRCISLDGSLEPANPEATKDKQLNIKHSKFIAMMADSEILGSGFLRRFTGKVAGMIATGHEEGASMAMSQLFMAFNNFGMAYPPHCFMYAMSSILKATYEDTPIVGAPEFVEEVKVVAKNVVAMASALRKENPIWNYDPSSN
jgi:multimeric flavodoxin WrbA